MSSEAPARDRRHGVPGRITARVRGVIDRARRSAPAPDTVVADVRRRPGRATALLVAVLAVPGAALWLLRPAAPPGVPLAEVREGPFEVTVVESGTLDALRSVTYSSSIVSNQAKIVALAPEGKLVEKGDLLILFDSAPFEEEIREHSARLAQARAELEAATKDRQLQALDNERELQAARQQVEHSRLELEDAREGEGRIREDESAAAVADAERELRRAEGQYEDLRPLLAEGFITRLELDRVEQQVEKAREDLALARRRHEALLRYGRPLELSQASSGAALTRDAVRQIETASRYRLEQKDSAIAAAQSRIEEAASQLAQARAQLARTEVRADVPGIVVYRKLFLDSEQRKPQVGDQVWANQPLLVLPDISRMVVLASVRETDVHKVAENQQVSVRVAAYPDLELSGRVSLIGTLAQEESRGRQGRFFRITVELDGSDPRLRPGMTARVRIVVSERASATHVPLEAVFERAGRTVVYVAEGDALREREVVLGPSNQDFVVVERGLRPGERVALVDPREPSPEFVGLPE